MKSMRQINNRVVAAHLAALAAAFCLAGPMMAADAAKIEDYLTRLPEAKDEAQAGRIESELMLEWSKSGSAAMDLLYQRGKDALDAGQYEAAIEHFTAAIDHDPDYLAAYDGRAAAYYNRGDLGPALEDLAQVLAREPRHFSALTGLGSILDEMGERALALEAYRQAAAIHPFIAEVNDAIARLTIENEGQEL